MNVLIIAVVSGFLPKFLMQDVHMLMKRGYVVHYATNFDNPIYECDKEALEDIGIKCFPISIEKSPFAFQANSRALKALNRIVKDHDIDVVYMHNPVGGVLGRALAIPNKNIITIYTAHGFHFYKGAPLINWLLYYPVERLFANITDVLITINHEDEKRAKTFKLRKNGIVKRIPSTGFEPKRFYFDENQKALLREKYDIKKDTFVFLSVGELNDNKNHATIIKAFAKANITNSQLLICGEGYKREQLQKLIEELKLEDSVKLCGYQTQIEDYYRMSDVFMFPSIREGMGMAAIEAMACGLPLIVSDNRGSREYARDNAIVCESSSIEGFAVAMQRMQQDCSLKEAMAKRSREIAPEFTKEQTLKVMKEIVERLEAEYAC